MQTQLNQQVYKQFGASLDTLENAIKLCPAELWETDKYFWYWSYHCLFFTDYYLSLEPKSFTPPSPFTMSEFDEKGGLPPKTYSKEELMEYAAFCRNKSKKLLNDLGDDILTTRFVDDWKDYTILEICLYNMRHIQHHAGQLNTLLRQEGKVAPKWVAVAGSELS